MRIKASLAKGLVAALILTLIPFVAFSAQKITPGTTCKVLNQKVVYKSKTYTCIKSGKKLIWNKGVPVKKSVPAISPTPTPTPATTPSPSSTPSPSPSQLLPQEHSPCTIPNQTIYLSTTMFKCVSYSNGLYRDLNWEILPLITAASSKTSSIADAPAYLSPCSNSGDRVSTAEFYMECRWVSPGNLRWIKINNIKSNFQNFVGSENIETCRLKNADSTGLQDARSLGGGRAGFPLTAINKMNNPGINKVLLAGVDFVDNPGGSELTYTLAETKNMMNEWISYFSGGKVKFDITIINQWLRAPKASTAYDRKYDKTQFDANYQAGVEAQNYINLITEKVDLSQFSTVYVLHPSGSINIPDDLIVRNHKFITKEGETTLNFFNAGRPVETMGTYFWAFNIHESLHDFNLIGHAPGNGWPFGIMQDQSGISLSLTAWEQFVLGWLPDSQIYCSNLDSLDSVTLSLSPMEREDSKTKTAIIRISKTQAIVVEAHGIDKWSNFNLNDRSFPPGFYGTMVYTVDLNLVGSTPCQVGACKPFDDDYGNNPAYPRYAYYVKTDGGKSFASAIGIPYRSNYSYRYNDHIGTLGDSFTVLGVKVTVIGTGDYETVKIEKVSK